MPAPGYIACPVCAQPAPVFNGGWVLVCARCLVTAYARQQGPRLVWALVAMDEAMIKPTACETRVRVHEPIS